MAVEEEEEVVGSEGGSEAAEWEAEGRCSAGSDSGCPGTGAPGDTAPGTGCQSMLSFYSLLTKSLRSSEAT